MYFPMYYISQAPSSKLIILKMDNTGCLFEVMSNLGYFAPNDRGEQLQLITFQVDCNYCPSTFITFIADEIPVA